MYVLDVSLDASRVYTVGQNGVLAVVVQGFPEQERELRRLLAREPEVTVVNKAPEILAFARDPNLLTWKIQASRVANGKAQRDVPVKARVAGQFEISAEVRTASYINPIQTRASGARGRIPPLLANLDRARELAAHRSTPVSPARKTPGVDLNRSPSTLHIRAGGLASETIEVTSRDGFKEPLQLSCSGAPAGVACEFGQNPVTPGPDSPAATPLTVKVAENVKPGRYDFHLYGRAGRFAHVSHIALDVLPASTPVPSSGPTDSTGEPARLALLFPKRGAHLVDGHPVFEWSLSQRVSGVEYELNVWEVPPGQSPPEALGGVPFFTERSIKGNVFRYPTSARPLEAGRQYVWRVVPATGAGVPAIIISPPDHAWFSSSPCEQMQIAYLSRVLASANPEGDKSYIDIAGLIVKGERLTDELSESDSARGEASSWFWRQREITVEGEGQTALGLITLEVPLSSEWEHPCTAGDGGAGQVSGVVIEGSLHLQSCCSKAEVTVEIACTASATLTARGKAYASPGNLMFDGSVIAADAKLTASEREPSVRYYHDWQTTKTLELEQCRPAVTYRAQWDFPAGNNGADPNGAAEALVSVQCTQKIVSSRCIR